VPLILGLLSKQSAIEKTSGSRVEAGDAAGRAPVRDELGCAVSSNSLALGRIIEYVGVNLPFFVTFCFCLVWSLYLGLPFHFLVSRSPSFGEDACRLSIRPAAFFSVIRRYSKPPPEERQGPTPASTESQRPSSLELSGGCSSDWLPRPRATAAMLNAVKRSRSQRMGGAGMVGQGQGLRAARNSNGDEEDASHAPLNQGPGPVTATALRPPNASRQPRLDRSDRLDRHGPQNAAVPPVIFPGGRNPYLERPLPPPPPPKTPKSDGPVVPATSAAPSAAPIMPVRPSTSSGPGIGSGRTAVTRPNFEKRLSKDDMSLTGQMGMSVGRTKGTQPYRFGGYRSVGLPTPEPSPNPSRMPSPPPFSSIPSRMPTPSSLSSGEIQIGMALGSPTTYTPSPLAGWQSQELMPPRDMYSPLPPQRTPEPPAQRQKTQKRKFFGSLFGRGKPAEPVKVPEFLDTNYTTFATVSNSSLHQSGEVTPLRSHTVTGKKAPKFMPIMRSRTEPEMEDAIQEAKKTSPQVKVTGPQPAFAEAAVPTLTSSLGGPGLLDIEIPDIRLERYSVMFSGLLNPQGGSTTSSLLTRRQATLEKLKTINDKIANEEFGNESGLVRRATSPHLSKSPSFSLFPPPRGRPNGTSPRTRSNTSPALLSPSRASFDGERQPMHEVRTRKEAKRVTIISPRTMDERSRAANVEKLREQQIQMQKVHEAPPAFEPEEGTFFLDSPASVSDVEEIIPAATLPLKPRIEEPQWEIISPPSTSALSETGSTTTKRTMSSTSSSASSVKTNITRPSIDIDEEDDDAALKAAVEISIARQISISRQQRNLLRTTNSAAPAAAPATRSASVKLNPMSKGLAGRVIETKQSMPKLVDMHLGQNRKSERVVLEAM